MIWVKVLALGVLQGLTEFLPISSSGHLVLARHWVGLGDAGVGFDILLHLGTMFAVLWVYRGDALEALRATAAVLGGRGDPARRSLVLSLALGLLPAVVVGFALRDHLEPAFESARFATAMLLVTATLLVLSGRWRRSTGEVTPQRALVIGLFQVVAILPGVSRSGSTIASGMMVGVRPDRAARFSFLMAVPLFLGAALLELPGYFAGADRVPVGPAVVGFLASFGAGTLAINWLLRTLRSGRFVYFGVYCGIVGVIGLLTL